MQKITDCFKNEYNSSICIEGEFTGHREITIGIKSLHTRSTWIITEEEATHLRDVLDQLVRSSPYYGSTYNMGRQE